VNKTVIAVALVATSTIGVACHLDTMTGADSQDLNGISNPLGGATYAAEWVGVYEGLGNVDVFDSGEHYSDVPMCLETWIEGRLLHAAVHLQISPPPEALMERPPVASDAPGGCAEDGVGVHVSTGTGNVTSNTVLTLGNWMGSSQEDVRRSTLRLQRQGDDLVGTLTVSLDYGTGRATGDDGELASVALRVSGVDG